MGIATILVRFPAHDIDEHVLTLRVLACVLAGARGSIEIVNHLALTVLLLLGSGARGSSESTGGVGGVRQR